MRYASNTMNRRNKTSQKNLLNKVQRHKINAGDLFEFKRPGTNVSPNPKPMEPIAPAQGSQERKVMYVSKDSTSRRKNLPLSMYGRQNRTDLSTSKHT